METTPRVFDFEPVIDDALDNALVEYEYLMVNKYLGLNFEEYFSTPGIIKNRYREYLKPKAVAAAAAAAKTANTLNELGDISDVR